MRWVPVVLALLAAPAAGQAPPPKPADDARTAEEKRAAEAKADAEFLLANYTKFEYRVPVRDGAKLFTVVYAPKDTSKTYPMLLLRTPYGVGPYGADSSPLRLSPSPLFWRAGYIFVHQDVRGRMKSEGTFVHGTPHNPAKTTPKDVDESSDATDTIDWLLKHVPGHNGNVGMAGISYPGFYTACAMIDAHPALKAVSPQAPVMDFFDGDDCRHNGAFLLAHNFRFFGAFPKLHPRMYSQKDTRDPDYGTPDGYRFFLNLGPLADADKKHFTTAEPFWRDQMQHPDYDDFCKARDLRPHVKAVKPAVLTVGGWYDAEDLAGTFHCAKRVADTSPDSPERVLVVGPWVHGGWARGDGDALGPVKFHQKTAAYYREHVELPFFEKHLKGAKTAPLPKGALAFETGTNRWRRFDAWPPKEAVGVRYSFAPGGVLTTDKPAGDGADSYPSDPNRPVPYVEKTSPRMENDYMTADQRHAGRRPDVLVYQTPVLSEDVCVAGPVEVELHVQTTGTDADFVVKLVDVYPDEVPDPDPNPADVRLGGYQQLVRGEPFRGKYRTSLAKPEPFKPGEPAVIRFAMPDVGHCFRSGHRIMVQVQSSWFPLIDRNPQVFRDIPTAAAADFKAQTHTVHRSAARPSGVTLRVVK